MDMFIMAAMLIVIALIIVFKLIMNNNSYVITSAVWASTTDSTKNIDVTTIVQNLTNTRTGVISTSGGFSVHASDPAPFVGKKLTINYTKKGATKSYFWVENGPDSLGVINGTAACTIQLP